MKKTPTIVALLVIVGILTAFALYRRSSGRTIANLGVENAMMSKRWMVAEARAALTSAFPGTTVHTSAYGGDWRDGSSYEVLTADDLYLGEAVSNEALRNIIEKLEESPDFEEWLRSGSQAGQQRKLKFVVDGPAKRPMLRILFLCSNLPDGELLNEGFKKNMWP